VVEASREKKNAVGEAQNPLKSDIGMGENETQRKESRKL
jgi:hypothetical protein